MLLIEILLLISLISRAFYGMFLIWAKFVEFIFFFVNSVPKNCKMSVEAVTVANSTFLFVKYFWVKFVISVAIYGNFFIRE